MPSRADPQGPGHSSSAGMPGEPLVVKIRPVNLTGAEGGCADEGLAASRGTIDSLEFPDLLIIDAPSYRATPRSNARRMPDLGAAPPTAPL